MTSSPSLVILLPANFTKADPLISSAERVEVRTLKRKLNSRGNLVYVLPTRTGSADEIDDQFITGDGKVGGDPEA